jgi:hypothetical protein
MAAAAVDVGNQQLALNETWMSAPRRAMRAEQPGSPPRVFQRGGAERQREAGLCAGCREREARYGFRHNGDDPAAERQRTLCFHCFRVELERRQAVAARLARGWNAQQVRLPLERTLDSLTRRRRRAQIAARRLLDAK